MTTGKVEVTSKTAAVGRETCELGQVETKNQELGTVKEELKEVTEMQGDRERVRDELYKIKEEQTQIEMVRGIEIEFVECFETQCEGQINLPQEQRETICSLEAGRDEVSPVRL